MSGWLGLKVCSLKVCSLKCHDLLYFAQNALVTGIICDTLPLRCLDEGRSSLFHDVRKVFDLRALVLRPCVIFGLGKRRQRVSNVIEEIDLRWVIFRLAGECAGWSPSPLGILKLRGSVDGLFEFVEGSVDVTGLTQDVGEVESEDDG